jgi:flagellar biosynthesis protein FlhG
MEDQAKHLRERLRMAESGIRTTSIAVISGKGGVGKSNFSLNFAMVLKEKGHSVLLVDMDIGMGNVDILLGVSSKYSIIDFFTKSIPLQEIICKIPGGIHYITGGSGLTKFTEITNTAFQHFFTQFSMILNQYEYVILDMGAGMNKDSLKFILSVDQVFVITTPEPTSIMDAYGAMKYIMMENSQIPFYMIVNRAQSEKEGQATFNRISKVMHQFLEKKAIFLGILPEDKVIQQAVKRQTPFIHFNGKAPASKSLKNIADQYCQQNFELVSPINNKTSFITNLKRILFER